MAITFSYESIGDWLQVTATWTSDASGDASDTTARIVGSLVKATTIPDGTAIPTDNYDITLTDDEGIDILDPCAQSLADRSNVAAQAIYCIFSGTSEPVATYPAVADAVTVTVANAGDSKAGVLKLLFRGALAGTST
ncbi:MAG: hypothetical protein H6747_07995 [Deltaproteobacteria bacterium]|nr:hypothetical protein [Deltaproteobacteria bacterium]